MAVIEHNLDVIACSRLGLSTWDRRAASGGGQLVAQGTPEQVADVEESHTGQFLRAVLAARRGRGSLNALARVRTIAIVGAGLSGT